MRPTQLRHGMATMSEKMESADLGGLRAKQGNGPEGNTRLKKFPPGGQTTSMQHIVLLLLFAVKMANKDAKYQTTEDGCKRRGDAAEGSAAATETPTRRDVGHSINSSTHGEALTSNEMDSEFCKVDGKAGHRRKPPSK